MKNMVLEMADLKFVDVFNKFLIGIGANQIYKIIDRRRINTFGILQNIQGLF